MPTWKPKKNTPKNTPKKAAPSVNSFKKRLDDYMADMDNS